LAVILHLPVRMYSAFCPVNRRDRSTKRSPPSLVGGERNGLLLRGHQMGAEYGANTSSITGALKLDRPVDAIGVGAGQRLEPTSCGSPGHGLGAGDADAEGEVGVQVKVDHASRLISGFVRAPSVNLPA